MREEDAIKEGEGKSERKRNESGEKTDASGVLAQMGSTKVPGFHARRVSHAATRRTSGDAILFCFQVPPLCGVPLLLLFVASVVAADSTTAQSRPR